VGVVTETGTAPGEVPLDVDELTFVFTDIVHSTELWDRVPERMAEALGRHDAVMDEAITGHAGRRVKHTGDGILAVFDRPLDAALAALEAQRRLAAVSWEGVAVVEARIGVHAGPADVRADDYFGASLNRCARIMALAHGGQVLASGTVADAIGDDARHHGFHVRSLGMRSLRGLSRPERIHQLDAPDLRRDFPPLGGDAAMAHLPRPATTLIGRRDDIARVREELARSRLVTLVGPGGVGKTRLALGAAAAEADEVERAVAYVSLEAAYSTVVASTIAGALGAPREGTQPVLDSLVAVLVEADLLLVLDNAEHVVAATSAVVDAVLSRCPNVSVLLTSQARLGIPGERVVHVDPLDTSPRGPAVQLFVERAGEADPSFHAAPHLDSISELCTTLDGLPLALELAAARVRSVQPEQILERLDRRLAFLRVPEGHPRAQRGSTLGEVIGWSHDLLDPDEQRLFARLGVFRGSFALEAADAVTGFDPIDEYDVVDVVDRLVRRSLVRVEEQAHGHRFRMLESVAVFAAERLAERDDDQPTRSRHADHYLAALSRLDPADAATVDALDLDLANVRAAVAWAAVAAPRRTAKLLLDRFRALNDLGWQDDAFAWFRITADSDPFRDRPERALLLQRIGQLATAAGHDFDVGRQALEEALELAQRTSDRPRAVRARLQLATLLSLYPASLDLDAASVHLSALEADLAGQDEPWAEAGMHNCAALVHLYRRESGAGAERARFAQAAASRAELDVLATNAKALEGANRAYAGDIASGLDRMEAAWAEAVAAGHDAVAASAAWLRGYASILLADPEDARMWFARELESGRPDTVPAIRRSLRANLGTALVLLGRVDDVATQAGDVITINGTLLGPILEFVRGDLDAVDRECVRLLDRLRLVGDRNEYAAVALWRARAHRARRQYDLARLSLDEALDIATEAPSCPYYEIPVRAEIALLGEEAQLPRLDQLAGEHPIRGLAARVHLAHAVVGPPEEAEARFAEALAVTDEYGLALDRIEVLIHRGARRRRTGDRTGSDADVSSVSDQLAGLDLTHRWDSLMERNS
jgi:predicted ATPase/class 3 adenylate cyclase